MSVMVFFDFDGVFNFEASRSAYRKKSRSEVFGHLKRNTVKVSETNVYDSSGYLGAYSASYGLNWSGELVRKLDELRTEYGFIWNWLTTWSHHTKILDRVLGIEDTSTVLWEVYLPAATPYEKLQEYRNQTKLDNVLAWVNENPGQPFVWVDDVATELWDDSFVPETTPRLVLVTDEKYGMNQKDFDQFAAFLKENS